MDRTNILKAFDGLTFKEWDTLIKYRGIHSKYPEQLVALQLMYEAKIPKLQKMLGGENDAEQITFLTDKIARLKEKYACVLKEQAFRANKLVTRELHSTDYYIDLTNGNDSRTGLKIGNNTVDSTADTTHFVDASLTGADDYINGSYVWNITVGAGSLITDFEALTDTVTLTSAIVGMAANDVYYILDAWLTIEEYTSVTVRTDGDNAYVRANTTETKTNADIAFDEDATFLLPHSIIGCDSVTNDPWNDDSDVRPIVNFNDTAYNFDGSSDDFWTIERLDVRQSADTNGDFYLAGSFGWVFNDCIFRESSASTGYGLRFNYSSVTGQNCSFYSNKTNNVGLADSYGVFISCSFSGGADTTDFGIYNTGRIFLDSCTFSSHDLGSVFSNAMAMCYARNCVFTDSVSFYTTSRSALFFSEDDDATKGNQYSCGYEGVISRDTSIELDSLASAKMTPASTVGLGLTLSRGYMQDYALWCPASATTITITARETAAWAVDPTAAEFYFEASYLNHATNATRSTVASGQGLSGTTEVSFTMTFTPAQVGWVYVLCYLKKYGLGKAVNVSVKPVVS